jgi:hypothetical protein
MGLVIADRSRLSKSYHLQLFGSAKLVEYAKFRPKQPNWWLASSYFNDSDSLFE